MMDIIADCPLLEESVLSPRVAEQIAVLSRGADEIIPEDEFAAKIERSVSTGVPLVVKLGLDPTAPDIHLGSAVVLRKLREFQDFGHRAVVLIGDFTATIGDPSGKSETRPMLTREDVKENAETYRRQYSRILDPDRTEVRFNSEWLGELSLADFVRIASGLTVARVLERDDFADRLSQNRPLGLHEILYPACQAYDSVALKADVELGGTDQKFNILMGRDLMRAEGLQPQVTMFMPLLVGTDGAQKMSKSLGNYIGVTEPPGEMFGKTMSIPDRLIPDYFLLATDTPTDEIETIRKQLGDGSTHPMELKKKLARRIITIYHNGEAAVEAQAEFERVFSKREDPTEPVTSPFELDETREYKLPTLLKQLGLTSSSGEARRSIRAGAVSINREKVTDENAPYKPRQDDLFRVGKLRFMRIVTVQGK
jgi:tyrosyl-tRNA synthetase